MKKHIPYLIVSLIVGILIGSQMQTIPKTPSSTYTGTQRDVTFARNIGLATFSGSWIPVSGEKILNDVNAVAIDCWLEKMSCHVAQADIYDDLFSNRINYYEITDWSEDGQITAITESICERGTLKADIQSKVVTLTESRLEKADDEMCAKNDVPVVLKLGPRGF